MAIFAAKNTLYKQEKQRGFMVSVNNAKQVLNLFVHNPMRSLARKPQVAQVFAEDLSKLKFKNKTRIDATKYIACFC